MNIPSSGPADLVAWNPETQKLLPIDVKSVRNPYVRVDGEISIGIKICFRADGVAQIAWVHGEAAPRLPEGFWEALGILD